MKNGPHYFHGNVLFNLFGESFASHGGTGSERDSQFMRSIPSGNLT